MIKKKVMFLCTGNSCRSQMAEGFARKFLGDEFEVYSAGTKRHGLNSRAVSVMNEIGIDISSHASKTTDELPEKNFDYVITVCDHAFETCPYFPAAKILHFSFRDPPAITKDFNDENEILKVYREVRDEIMHFVKDLRSRLANANG